MSRRKRWLSKKQNELDLLRESLQISVIQSRQEFESVFAEKIHKAIEKDSVLELAEGFFGIVASSRIDFIEIKQMTEKLRTLNV